MSLQSLPRPNAWRLLLGFALAPLLAAIFYLIVQGGLDWEFLKLVLFYGGYPPAIVLGVPAYFALRYFFRPHIAILMLVGGVVAALPWLVLISSSRSNNEMVGNCNSVIDGKITWCGFLLDAEFLAGIFAAGAFGGLVFWFCVVWRDNRLAGAPHVERVVQG